MKYVAIISLLLLGCGIGVKQEGPFEVSPVNVTVSFDLDNIKSYFNSLCLSDLASDAYSTPEEYSVAVSVCTEAKVAQFLQAFASIFGTNPTPTPTP